MNAYFDILQILQNAKIDFAVIGTGALKCYCPESMKSYQLRDCDIVISPHYKMIRNTIGILNENNWDVTVWNEKITDTVSEEFLQGKYYIRATKDGKILDITYECRIDWEKIMPARIFYNGLPLASFDHILELKREKMIEQNNLEAFHKFVNQYLLGQSGNIIATRVC